MANRNVYDPTPNHDIDFDIMTIREYLNTLSDKEYAEEVMDYARTLLAEFSRSSRPLTVKDQDFRFSIWLKSQKIVLKHVDENGNVIKK